MSSFEFAMFGEALRTHYPEINDTTLDGYIQAVNHAYMLGLIDGSIHITSKLETLFSEESK